MKKATIIGGLFIALSVSGVSFAQQSRDSRPGSAAASMNIDDLTRKNKEGGAAVAAVRASSSPLSTADKDLMMRVAMGGMQQLEISRIAVQKASSENVRKLAQLEVEEQTGLSNKLKEIAAAKGITLPTSPDAGTQAMIERMQGMSGADFDRNYVQKSGVEGHEKLDSVMSTVHSSAQDASLKSLASAAHPLVKAHLQASRDMLKTMQ